MDGKRGSPRRLCPRLGLAAKKHLEDRLRVAAHTHTHTNTLPIPSLKPWRRTSLSISLQSTFCFNLGLYISVELYQYPLLRECANLPYLTLEPWQEAVISIYSLPPKV